ncbi:glycosyltransferase [Lactococcus lactis]|uniref:glycosyltransferase n=1 Tax=Lactococcus lactis TaxID=1358 RepID=UPI00288D68B5|nr:glycosyltransferase [Lactococcus lactis]MDT2872722.1 glycosyltransferase [Lactococcus lactis]
MNNKKISVVIATYNASGRNENYFMKQINSIFNQTILPDEIVFTDDCSKDNTLCLINEIVKKNDLPINIKVCPHDKNQGFVNNFFDGIMNSSGDIIFLCDQDDIWLSNKVEKTIELFNSNYDMIAIHSNLSVIDNNNKLIKKKFISKRVGTKKININQFLKEIHYPGMALAFKSKEIKNDIEKIYKSNAKICTHDYLICFLAVLQRGFYISDEVYTLRRLTGYNVALSKNFNDSSNNKRNISNRVKQIKLYQTNFVMLQEVNKYTGLDIKEPIEKYIKCNEKRIMYLENKKSFELAKNLLNILYYPSIRAFIADFLIISRG